MSETILLSNKSITGNKLDGKPETFVRVNLQSTVDLTSDLGAFQIIKLCLLTNEELIGTPLIRSRPDITIWYINEKIMA